MARAEASVSHIFTVTLPSMISRPLALASAPSLDRSRSEGASLSAADDSVPGARLPSSLSFLDLASQRPAPRPTVGSCLRPSLRAGGGGAAFMLPERDGLGRC